MALCKNDEMRPMVPDDARLIGLDVGKKTIGVASCDSGWRIASPLTLITRRKFAADMDALFGLIDAEANIGGLVIGWPLNMDGSEGPRCDSVRDFTHAMLRERSERGLPDLSAAFHDERLSSKVVEDAMLAGDLSRSKRAARRDSLAAAWILQGFIDRVD